MSRINYGIVLGATVMIVFISRIVKVNLGAAAQTKGNI